MALRLYNTLTKKLESFKPISGNVVRLYTCGPTVYNVAHMGNFRAYMFEDLLRRYLKYKGFHVKQVMNLTDVDDKTIRDSQKEGVPLTEFTERYAKLFFEDLDALGIERAEHYPRATDHIPEMIELIKILIEKKYAYTTPDGCVWYSIKKYKKYGKLAGIDTSQLQAGASGRVLNDEYEKEQASDFALWKAWDKTDGDVAWDSPWGKGRPGWHIECSAMAMKHLTDSFEKGAFNPVGFRTLDLHTGGVDNIFPHHQDEIAQSEGVTKKPFAKYWMHNEHLLVDGKKMSKSLGNFYTLRDLLAKGFKPMGIRYLLIAAHYRQKMNLSMESLHAAEAAVKTFDEFLLHLDDERAERDTLKVPKLIAKAEKSFQKAMDNDLGISEALAHLHNFMSQINKLRTKVSKKDAQEVKIFMRSINSVLGIMSEHREDAPQDILALVERREVARRAKDWRSSDAIRDELKAKGWYVEDLPQGPRPRRIE